MRNAGNTLAAFPPLRQQSAGKRLYAHLEDEYAIPERPRAVERKLELISTTAETILDILQTKRGLRVEWLIVILILVEILITLYELFLHPGR